LLAELNAATQGFVGFQMDENIDFTILSYARKNKYDTGVSVYITINVA